MEISKAIEIFRKLEAGFNPYTGERLPPLDLYTNQVTLKALHAAIYALEKVQAEMPKEFKGPLRHGRPWTKEEDRQLAKAFKSGKSINLLANMHRRAEGGIRARLEKLGIIDKFYCERFPIRPLIVNGKFLKPKKQRTQ